MTEKECLAAGIAVSLFAHFALLIAPRPPEPEPSFTTVVQMDMASPAVATSREKGIGIAAASPRDMNKADAANRTRQAFLRITLISILTFKFNVCCKNRCVSLTK